MISRNGGESDEDGLTAATLEARYERIDI